MFIFLKFPLTNLERHKFFIFFCDPSMGIILALELKRHGCEITSVPITKIHVMLCNKVSFRAHHHLVCHERQTSQVHKIALTTAIMKIALSWIEKGAWNFWNVEGLSPWIGKKQDSLLWQWGEKENAGFHYFCPFFFLLSHSIIFEHHNFMWGLLWRSEGSGDRKPHFE